MKENQVIEFEYEPKLYKQNKLYDTSQCECLIIEMIKDK